MVVPRILFHLGPYTISAHFILESLAYTLAFALYRHDKRLHGDTLPQPHRNSVIVAAILGAALGSRLLAALEDPALIVQSHALSLIFAGKTIVGALLGGTLAVEWVKSRLAIRERTGDLFTLPLILGIAIGRLGCFFGGLDDHTYGLATNLPWAVDFGDGIPRHPAQLYEILFLIILGAGLLRLRPHFTGGRLYRLFLLSYLSWRLAADFFKPAHTFAGLSAIQWACAFALLCYAPSTLQMFASLNNKETFARG